MLAFRHEIIHIAMWCQITATATKRVRCQFDTRGGGSQREAKKGPGLPEFWNNEKTRIFKQMLNQD